MTIPDSVTGIGSDAFYECSSLSCVYYAGTEEDWNRITIYGDNACLTNATIHFNSTGPEDEDNSGGSVRYFSEWDAENQIAYFADMNIPLGAAVTEETDISFIESIDSLLGQCVLVKTKSRADDQVGPDILLSISPVETKRGTVTDVDDSSITIDGVSYSLSKDWFWAKFYVGAQVIYYLSGSDIVGIEELETLTGTLISWNAETGKISIDPDGLEGATAYMLSPLADEGTIEKLEKNIGEDVRFVCDSNQYIYEVSPAHEVPGDSPSDDTGCVFPDGYNFATDSYNFKNYGEKLSKKYFTTIYEAGPGAALYKVNKNASEKGLCFGMAYTTASIYNGSPDCSVISTLDNSLKYKLCDNIRDIVNSDLVSSEFVVGNNKITIDDFIKYAFVYQWSTEVAKSTKDTLGDMHGLYNAVKNFTDENRVGVTIGLWHCTEDSNGQWEIDGGHRVLAVGYEGNDILIDDPNNKESLERLSIVTDDKSAWTYSGAWTSDGVNNGNSIIRYQVDYDRPYQILSTGRKTSVAGSDSENSTKETYIEGMERLDAENTLVYIEKPNDVLLPESSVEIIGTEAIDTKDKTGYPGKLYWVESSNSVLVSNLTGRENTVIIANDDTMITVDADQVRQINGTINESTQDVAFSTSKGSECIISYVTVMPEQDVELRIVGETDSDEITVQSTDTGLTLSGLSNGSVELLRNEELVTSVPFSNEKYDLKISYDNTGENDDVTLTSKESTSSISGSGSSTASTYTISTFAVENGTVSVYPKSASAGTTVTITVTPDTGYQLDKLTVTDKNGNSIKLTDQGNGKYTFTMPASKVSIDASFAEVEVLTISLPFTDVTASDWFYDGVAYVVSKGMMKGVSDTAFAPKATTTRGMLVTILYRLEGEPAANGSGFSDVENGAWYQAAVDWAAANGIVNGTSETTFAPNGTLTREQMAAILYRYAAYKGYDMSQKAQLDQFQDQSAVSGYAEDALAWANAAGLITGVTDTTLSPKGSAVRAQTATILMRFCESVVQ